MNIRVSGKHVEVTPALEAHAEKRIQKIKRFFEGILDVHVILTVEKRFQRAEINIQADGVFLHGDARSEDLYKSIDIAVSRIQTQLLKYKQKLKNHRLRQAGVAGPAPTSGVNVNVFSREDVEFGEKEPLAIRSRHYQMKAMTLEEAAMQMDLSHQQVLIFRDESNSRINILFRRFDGDYELIIPEEG